MDNSNRAAFATHPLDSANGTVSPTAPRPQWPLGQNALGNYHGNFESSSYPGLPPAYSETHLAPSLHARFTNNTVSFQPPQSGRTVSSPTYSGPVYNNVAVQLAPVASRSDVYWLLQRDYTMLQQQNRALERELKRQNHEATQRLLEEKESTQAAIDARKEQHEQELINLSKGLECEMSRSRVLREEVQALEDDIRRRNLKNGRLETQLLKSEEALKDCKRLRDHYEAATKGLVHLIKNKDWDAVVKRAGAVEDPQTNIHGRPLPLWLSKNGPVGGSMSMLGNVPSTKKQTGSILIPSDPPTPAPRLPVEPQASPSPANAPAAATSSSDVEVACSVNATDLNDAAPSRKRKRSRCEVSTDHGKAATSPGEPNNATAPRLWTSPLQAATDGVEQDEFTPAEVEELQRLCDAE